MRNDEGFEVLEFKNIKYTFDEKSKSSIRFHRSGEHREPLVTIDNLMHPELARTFAFFDHKFPGTPVAIGGSAVRDYDRARDIDVMVLAGADYPFMVGRLGTRYNGWNVLMGANGVHTPVNDMAVWPSDPIIHLRRTIHPIWLEGVSKPVQLCQSDACLQFSDHPHALLLPNGSWVNKDCFYDKPRR